MSRKGRSSLGGFGASLSALSLGRTSSPGWGEDDVWDSSSDSEEPPQTSRSAATAPVFSSSGRPGLRSSSQSFAGSLGLATSPASTSSAGSLPRPPARSSTSSSVLPTERSSSSYQSTPVSKPPAPMRSASGSSSSSSWLPHWNGKLNPAQTAEVPLEAQELAYVSLGTGDDGPDTLGEGDDDDGNDSEPEEDEGPVVKEELEEILLDPISALRPSTSSHGYLDSSRDSEPPSPSVRSPTTGRIRRGTALRRTHSTRTDRKISRFRKALAAEREINMTELKGLAWNGVPDELRPIVWQLLLDYLPSTSASRHGVLSEKRQAYLDLVHSAFKGGTEGLDQGMWHQITIDIPRTRPNVPLWTMKPAQRALERILYVWAVKHPDSGYVQGINDLVIPFFQTFLAAYINVDPETFDVSLLPEHALSAVEADSFWCLDKMLSGVHDYYIVAQPGIIRSVRKMAELVARIDPLLANHLEDQGVEFMQFAFRWMNCLLMRELSMPCVVRMWDTYLTEGIDAFSQFHLYVCSAFLVKWSAELREKDFQEIIMYLQNLPTQDWTDAEVRMLLSEAYVLMSVWVGTDAHFTGAVGGGGGMGGR